jgi:hypothetical protein
MGPVPSANIRRPMQQQARLPMPLGGLNYVDSTLSMPPTDAYLLDNIVVRPFGCEVRKGWRYWLPMANAFPAEVRTIMTFGARDPVDTKMFCSTSEGTSPVYDITLPNAAPALSMTPSTQPTILGEWYYTNFASPAKNYLCMVAAGAGYYTYSLADGWVEHVDGAGVGEIEFPVGDSTSTKDFCFIWVWKSRIWFLKKKSSVAYYLPINSIAGKVQPFDFGSQLDHGGDLAFGVNWTYDSGKGIDDSLVIVSREGDVLVYQGTDPASIDTFSMQGVWYCGRVPYGRRGFCTHGGDLLILNEYGVTALSDLVSGRLHTSSISGTLAFKMNPRLARIISGNSNNPYWFLIPYPSEEFLLVGTPFFNETTGIRQSFIMNSIMNAWSSVSELDMLCAEVYNGDLIVGTRTGQVIRAFTGFADGVSSDGTDTGSEVTGRIQTSFNDLGSATMNKRLLRTKVYGFAEAEPSIYCTFKSEYVLNELLSTPAPVQITIPAWDTALWDTDIWQTANGSFHRWIGVSAFGKKMSFQCAVRGAGRVLMTDYEVLFEQGNNL